MKQKQIKILAMAAITVLIIAAIVIYACKGGDYLVLRNGDTGEEYARYRIAEGDEFSIMFIHSVNKSPLTDVYQLRGHKIYVVRTIYYGFGAGVQTQIEEGQTLTYGGNGEMIVSGFHQEMPRLVYFVGTVSDHTLTIHGNEISLRELCGRNSKVEFSCEHKLF